MLRATLSMRRLTDSQGFGVADKPAQGLLTDSFKVAWRRPDSQGRLGPWSCGAPIHGQYAAFAALLLS